MKESRFTVNHVQLTEDRPFAEVTRRRSGTGRASGEGIVGSDRFGLLQGHGVISTTPPGTTAIRQPPFHSTSAA